MTYAILDDKFHSNLKILEAGNDAAGVYARSLSYCGDQLTDGFVPLSWAKMIATQRVLDKLTKARLWRPVATGDFFVIVAGDGVPVHVMIPANGFYIEDFLKINPRRESVQKAREEVRRKRSEAGKRGAAARWQNDGKRNGTDDGTHDGKPLASEWQTDGPQPQPQPQPQLLKDFLQQQQPTQDQGLIDKLLAALTDQTERTERTVRRLITEHRLADADIAWALECATGPGVVSPTRVAVAELRKRADRKAA